MTLMTTLEGNSPPSLAMAPFPVLRKTYTSWLPTMLRHAPLLGGKSDEPCPSDDAPTIMLLFAPRKEATPLEEPREEHRRVRSRKTNLSAWAPFDSRDPPFRSRQKLLKMPSELLSRSVRPPAPAPWQPLYTRDVNN